MKATLTKMRKLVVLLILVAFLVPLTAIHAEEPIQKIVVAFPTWSGPPADLEMVQEKLNEISREKIGVEAELLVIDFGSYGQQMTLMMSGTEQLDVMSCLGPGNLFITGIQNGQLLDLEENSLLQEYGQGIIDAVGQEYIDACRVGGVLYGLPNNRDMAAGKGAYSIRTDLLEEIGYEFQNEGEIESGTMEDINDIFAAIHDAHPELEVYRPVATALQQDRSYDPLGGNNYGVLLNPAESLEVEDLFKSDLYKDYCQQRRDWFLAGYISPDAATDTTAVGDLVKAGVLAAYDTGGKPGIKAQETQLCGYDMTIIQTDVDFMSSSSVSSFPWAIPYNTADPVTAMKWLNLVYTDPDMMNLLCWGVEGVHYVEKEDGQLTFPEGVDAMSSGYNHAMNWMFPNQYILKVWEGNSPDIWEQTKQFNDESIKSKALGFTFDTAPIATEFTSVSNVYSEYQASLEFGLMDTEEGLEALNEKMASAGLDIIIQEKADQLARWVEENDIS